MSFLNPTPITRDLSDEAMPIGDLSSAWKDPLREFGAAAKSVFNDFVYGLRPAKQNPNLPGGEPPSSAKPLPRPFSPIDSSPAGPAPINYLNAELAKHYGMSAQTAYAEAMSNTAYQRAVADMKAAGLNPALLAQSGYAQPASGGFAGSLASGSSGYRSSGPGSSAKSVSDNSGVWQAIASLVTAGAVFAATKSTAGAVGAAITAKTLATVAGQAAKAWAKK